MIKIFLTLLFFILLPLTLDARRNGEGFFIGYGVGGTHYYDEGAVNDVGGSRSDFSGTGKFYMGYKYDHDVTLEGAFTNYGYFKVEKDGETFEEFIPMSGAVYINYGHDFLHNQLRPFIVLGGGLLWINDKKNAMYDEEVFFSLHYGFGMIFTPNLLYGWGLRYAYEADWSRYQTKSITGTKLKGGNYDNILGTVYIGLQYKF